MWGLKHSLKTYGNIKILQKIWKRTFNKLECIKALALSEME